MLRQSEANSLPIKAVTGSQQSPLKGLLCKEMNNFFEGLLYFVVLSVHALMFLKIVFFLNEKVKLKDIAWSFEIT